MKTGNHSPIFGIGLLSAVLLLTFLFQACHNDPVEVPNEEVFTKAKREQLGQLLLNDILSNNEFIPKFSPYDSAYWYVQTLFDQATSVMREDSQSPTDNRWTGGWEVYIIDNQDLQHAFMLPGGNLFITTGMLKRFEKSYEVYYLLTFEAVLMNEGYLLDLLKQEYNSLTLINLIDGRAAPSGITVADIADGFPNLEFEKDVVRDADKETVSSICITSLLKPTGITISLNDPNFHDSKWMSTRKSHSDRASIIQNYAKDQGGDCGGNIGNNNNDYRKYVLNVLD